MATLRDIKSRISGVSSIERITSAMKMVSFVKSKKVQRQAEDARPYNKETADLLELISSMNSTLKENNVFFKSQNETVKNVVIIVVGSDKGMCGSFNSNLFKRVDSYLKDKFQLRHPGATYSLVTIGTKATDYYKKRNHSILHAIPGAFQNLDFSLVNTIQSLFVNDFINGKVDLVAIFYNKFVNVMRQDTTVEQILPVRFDAEFNIVQETKKEEQYGVKYFYEPDEQTIFDMLVKQYLKVQIWAPLIESNAAEQSARLLAMDKATQNAQELIRNLHLQYNNARQAAITTEMLEIVGGAEALKK